LNPRIAVVAGPSKDHTFILSGDEVSIGRDSSNVIAISDVSLSRRHCLLRKSADGYILQDLDSRNGTFVNGEPVKEVVLKGGDKIAAGDSILLFHLQDEAEELGTDQVEFDDSLTHATAQLRVEDLIYLNPDRLMKEVPANSRISRNLGALLKFSNLVHAIHDINELQDQILTSIFEGVPAERGAILINQGADGGFDSVFARHRISTPQPSFHVSRTIIRQVTEQGLAVLAVDVANSGFGGAESLVVSNVRSLLCVPLTMLGKTTGAIYLDSSSFSGRFDDDDLQLVAGIAGIASVALHNSARQRHLEQENLRLASEISLEHNMVGDSPAMKAVYQFLSRVAPKDTTVLIDGESGTGKELAARALHRSSSRSAKPFVAINCAAIPEGLLESELFGHEKGAFTDATSLKKGRLEMAQGGVVFLDEIGELAPALQVKLLRVLQEREFERVGGTRPIAIDIRIIAATNKDLDEAVKTGLFRLDLFYRLNVLSLTMPSLRDRREDVPLLANYFLTRYCNKFNLKPKAMAPATVSCLANYDWPGNVRELENAIERALVLSTSDTILPEDLPEALLERDYPDAMNAKYHSAIKNLKRQLILNALEESKGSYTDAARILGVHANYLHRLIRNLDLKDAARSATSGKPGGKPAGSAH
jgi:transcriptional regulator with GAF, ATPase, and Fis domain